MLGVILPRVIRVAIWSVFMLMLLRHRLYVNTRTTACSGNAQQTKAADTGGIGGAGERVCRAELDRETEQNIWRDYAEVAAGANACKMLLELVENNFEVIR